MYIAAGTQDFTIQWVTLNHINYALTCMMVILKSDFNQVTYNSAVTQEALYFFYCTIIL